MANEKLPQLPSLTAITGQDLFYVVDVSDPTDDPTGSSKGITRDDILQNITGLTATTISATTISATTVSATTISGTTFYGDGTNLTGVLKGEGTTNYLPKWTGTTALGNSQIQDNAQGVGIGIAPLINYRLNVYGAVNVYSSLRVGLTTIGDAASIGAEIRGIDKGIVTTTQSDGGGIGITAAAANDGGDLQSGDFIGGFFNSSGGNGGVAYSVQLQDGTEGVDKILQSQTSDGKSNWVDPSTIQTAFNYGLSYTMLTGNYMI